MKKIVSLVLASLMVFCLSACGRENGGNSLNFKGTEVDMTGKDAINLLDFEFESIKGDGLANNSNVYTNDFKTNYENNGSNVYYYTSKWKIVIKDEYKSEYRLSEIVSADYKRDLNAKYGGLYPTAYIDEKKQEIEIRIPVIFKADGYHEFRETLTTGGYKLDKYIEPPYSGDEGMKIIKDNISFYKDSLFKRLHWLNDIHLKVIKKN